MSEDKKKKGTSVQEVIDNIRDDRNHASFLLTDLLMHIKQNTDRHRELGTIAAKYLEVLQKSNEQLVKVAMEQSKQDNKEPTLSDDDMDDLFETIGKKEE